MRSRDLVRFVFGGLRRQKGRTALTLLGVGVGACALAFSVSLGLGLRAMIEREFQKRASFWDVQVTPKPRGELADETDVPPGKIAVPDGVTGGRRERLRRGLLEQYRNSTPRKPPRPLTHESAEEFARLPDVADVVAMPSGLGTVRLGDRSLSALILARRLTALNLDPRVVQGEIPEGEGADADGLVINERALLQLGLQSDAEFDGVIGRAVEVTFGEESSSQSGGLARAFGLPAGDLSTSQEQLLAKIARQLPQALDGLDLHPLERAAVRRMLAEQERKKAGEKPKGPPAVYGTFKVVAVVRDATAEEARARETQFDYHTGRADLFLPGESGRRLFERVPANKENGYYSVTVKVRPGGDLRAVTAAIEAAGFQQYSALEWYDSVRMEVTMIAGGLNLFALVSLFVAGLGITNTLATSVVERTREIGILKAVGATRGQVMRLFLLEGTAVGLVGGALGLLVAYLLSWPGDTLVARLVTEQSQGRLTASTVFVFPAWLPVATILFTLTATTLAATFPARRAANLTPVEALRAI